MIEVDVKGYRLPVDSVKSGWNEHQPDPEYKGGWISVVLDSGALIKTNFVIPIGDADHWIELSKVMKAALDRLLLVPALTTGDYIPGDR